MLILAKDYDSHARSVVSYVLSLLQLSQLTLQRGATSTARPRENVTCRGATSAARLLHCLTHSTISR